MIEMRKGISPVIAIILLLMMTVAAAGGTFLWIQNMTQGQQEQATEELNKKMEVVDLACDTQSGNDRFRAFIENSGSVDIDTSEAEVRVTSVADGTLQLTQTFDWSDKSFGNASGSDWVPAQGSWTDLSQDVLEDGLDYRFEFSFPNSDFTTSETCTAREIA